MIIYAYAKRNGHRYRDLSGIKQPNGMLTAVEVVSKNKHGCYIWRCVCDCGKTTDVLSGSFVNCTTRSCGCLNMKRLRENPNSLKHGRSVRDDNGRMSKEYQCWLAMRTRCLNPKDISYNNYGGRGITVCDKWLNSFENFLNDIGNAPSPDYTLERDDNDGNYEPGNVTWKVWKEQCRNRRTTLWVDYDGRKVYLAEVAELEGIKYKKLWKYFKKDGLPLDEAIRRLK